MIALLICTDLQGTPYAFEVTYLKHLGKRIIGGEIAWGAHMRYAQRWKGTPP